MCCFYFNLKRLNTTVEKDFSLKNKKGIFKYYASLLFLQTFYGTLYYYNFWSLGIMECTCMLFTFENGVPLMR